MRICKSASYCTALYDFDYKTHSFKYRVTTDIFTVYTFYKIDLHHKLSEFHCTCWSYTVKNNYSTKVHTFTPFGPLNKIEVFFFPIFEFELHILNISYYMSIKS